MGGAFLFGSAFGAGYQMLAFRGGGVACEGALNFCRVMDGGERIFESRNEASPISIAWSLTGLCINAMVGFF